MSHLRNLLHTTSGRNLTPPPISWNSVPEEPKPTLSPSAETATAVVDLPAPHDPPEVSLLDLSQIPVLEADVNPANRIVAFNDPRGPAADRFRYLRMRLTEHWKTGKLKKLLVTGALPQDGKSTVILNLATALSERGKRNVLVVEADLHHSSLVRTLGLSPWAGLSECLIDGSSPFPLIRRIDPLSWYLLPAGEPRKNPTELLQNPTLGYVLNSLTPSFDWVLIDSPPVVPLTDSISIRQHTDATLLVVRAGQTPREAIEQTIALLGKKNILGIVFNGAEAHNKLYNQYRTYTGHKHPQPDKMGSPD